MSGDQGGGVPYIGSRISLISKTDIRYEGLLFNIDTRQSMVALQNVRSFGTEGRRPDHIPPSDTVLQYATFKASEIKDLHVCEAAAPPPLPPKQQKHVAPPPPPSPKALVQPPPQPVAVAQQPPFPQPHRAPPPLPKQPVAQPGSASQYQQPPLPSAARPASPKRTFVPPTSSALLTPGAMSKSNTSHAVQHVEQHHSDSQRQQQPSRQVDHPPRQQPSRQEYAATSSAYHNVNPPAPSSSSQSNAASRTIPGMGGHLLRRKERRVNNETGLPEGGATATGGEFDFAGGLGDFDKEKEFSKLTVQETSRPVVKGSYQKSSFFDTISCDALDRLEGNGGGRMRAQEERKLNTETFGAVSLNNRRPYRGNRRNGNGNGNGGYNGGYNANGNGQRNNFYAGQPQGGSQPRHHNGPDGNRGHHRTSNNLQQAQPRHQYGGNRHGQAAATPNE
ncbi:hypothetical protein DYB30_000837 [Aphanomyces astaci]|uniref:DFDF domain-containing protein n=1 Tax=Aphanomyces astaci TaxID=112090 RepID=A0A397CMQ0_APHAT|nr:hypothetical protein DYB30_000837 [Aphanomyces astaci]RHY66871.1 hypothetical protein DYB34_007403 [Aphanomyces astaci]RHZ22852.1 hypothetical protein DYB26_000665 [Aphanomyces astaci]